MSTHALASLTANYTDSEPEGEEEEPASQDEKEKSSEDSNSRAASLEPSRSQGPSRQPSPEPIKIPYAKLVSYNDDADLEDDEDAELRVLSPNTGSVDLPPEPMGRVSPRIAEKVAKLYERMEAGMDMNMLIQNRKEFRNPSIYEKLIQFCGINELGTNYPATVYDPQKWGPESYYEELAMVQKNEMIRREKEKKKVRPEFVVGTKKALVEDDPKKRKSKWDQVTGGTGGGGLLRQSGILQSTLTGTKSTVISAFGSLPKKPKL